jgi:isopenicillin N synthase-like dioxygenase
MTHHHSTLSGHVTEADGLVPVIDLSPLRDGSDPHHVAEALYRASRDVGFLYVRNHGLDTALLTRSRSLALEFFHQSPDAKQALGISDRHRGFLGMGAARMQDKEQPDLKESFIWGHEDAQGQVPHDHALRGANRWPTAMPELRPVALAFADQADRLARHLLKGFALGLGLQPGFFLQTTTHPLSRAAFVYYPPQSAGQGEGRFGVAPHTDFGMLTILCQDDVGGLQVQDANGQWRDAPPIPDTLVVNVGDLLARWTGHVYRSTPHRVINRSARERLSLVFAFDPDPQTMIDPRQVVSDGTATVAPISCGDYLQWRFAKSFAYRAEAAQVPAPAA